MFYRISARANTHISIKSIDAAAAFVLCHSETLERQVATFELFLGNIPSDSTRSPNDHKKECGQGKCIDVCQINTNKNLTHVRGRGKVLKRRRSRLSSYTIGTRRKSDVQFHCSVCTLDVLWHKLALRWWSDVPLYSSVCTQDLFRHKIASDWVKFEWADQRIQHPFSSKRIVRHEMTFCSPACSVCTQNLLKCKSCLGRYEESGLLISEDDITSQWSKSLCKTASQSLTDPCTNQRSHASQRLCTK